MSGLRLSAFVSRFEATCPRSLAEKWDNIGLLVEPEGDIRVRKVMLTNDLTEDVMDEALSTQSNLIFSYHPPIFSAMKRVTQSSWKTRIVSKCLKHDIAIYSPHTIFDNMKGGVTDWLLSPFNGTKSVLSQGHAAKPIGGLTHCLTLRDLPPGTTAEALGPVLAISGPDCKVSVRDETATAEVTVECMEGRVMDALTALSSLPGDVRITKLERPPVDGQGGGRMVQLEKPLTLAQVVEEIKKLTGLERIRLTRARGKGMDSSVSSIATCAGSGRSVLVGTPADVWLTGEMSHHELLDAAHEGTSVILCEHSNSERNFLPTLRDRFAKEMFADDEDVEFVVSKTDRDPVEIV